MFTAPALAEVGNQFQATRFNGSLGFPSIYREDPSPEVDAAWDELTMSKKYCGCCPRLVFTNS